MTNKEIADHNFARNPEIKELHITSDGMPFVELHRAEAHAQRFVDNKVDSFKRDQELEAEEVEGAKADAKAVEDIEVKEAKTVKAKK